MKWNRVAALIGLAEKNFKVDHGREEPIENTELLLMNSGAGDKTIDDTERGIWLPQLCPKT